MGFCRVGFWMKRLTGAEALSALREAALLRREMGTDEAIVPNACLVAASARRFFWRCFSSGAAALSRLTPAEIGALASVAVFGDASSAEIGEAEMEAISRMLRELPALRLRARVLRKFGIFPGERRANDISAGDILFAALEMKLSKEERMERLCPACREGADGTCPVCGRAVSRAEENPNFSMERFEALKAGAAIRAADEEDEAT